MLVGRWQVQQVEDMEVTRLAAAEGTVNLSHPVMFMGGGVLGGWEGFGEGVGDEGAEERADGDLRALRRGEGVRGVRLVGEVVDSAGKAIHLTCGA